MVVSHRKCKPSKIYKRYVPVLAQLSVVQAKSTDESAGCVLTAQSVLRARKHGDDVRHTLVRPRKKLETGWTTVSDEPDAGVQLYLRVCLTAYV